MLHANQKLSISGVMLKLKFEKYFSLILDT